MNSIKHFIFKFIFILTQNKMPIYVDTSYIKGIKKSIKQKNQKCFFTSSLTILEIATHYFNNRSERIFNITKSCLEYINKIKIDWRMTEEVFNDAFPNKKKKYIKCGDLKKLYCAFLASKNESELIEKIATINVTEAIDYDIFLGKGMSGTNRMVEFVDNLEKAFNNNSIQNFVYQDSLPPTNVKDFLFDMYNTHIEAARIFILYSLLMRRELNDPQKNPIDGYNDSLELMLSAMAHHLFEKAYHKNKFKRNDMIDLYHLAYVNKFTRIMSKEKVIKEYVKKYQPYSLIEE